MNQNLNYLFVYCTFVPAENSLNAQPSPMRKPLAPIQIDTPPMTDEEMIETIKHVEGLGGMTVNERLFASGLMHEFDTVKKTDKAKARRILELLQVDKFSIDKIIQ